MIIAGSRRWGLETLAENVDETAPCFISQLTPVGRGRLTTILESPRFYLRFPSPSPPCKRPGGAEAQPDLLPPKYSPNQPHRSIDSTVQNTTGLLLSRSFIQPGSFLHRD